MNWYKINFSIDDAAAGTVIEIMEWFKRYLMEHSLFNEAILYESDEITPNGIEVFIYSRNSDLITDLSDRCMVMESPQPAKEEICLVVGAREFGDSLFANELLS
jgi:hypothetical protein